MVHLLQIMGVGTSDRNEVPIIKILISSLIRGIKKIMWCTFFIMIFSTFDHQIVCLSNDIIIPNCNNNNNSQPVDLFCRLGKFVLRQISRKRMY